MKTRLYLFLMWLAFVYLNILTPRTHDDLVYGQATSVWMVIRTELSHYRWWSGRTLAHLAARYFLMIDERVFWFINGAIFTFLIYLIWRHISGSAIRQTSISLLVTAATSWLLIPSIGDGALWKVGSCNYLWTATAILLFLLPYSLVLRNQPLWPWMQNPGWMFMVGLMAGWGIEHASIGGLVCAAMLAYYYKSKHSAITPWQKWGLWGNALGVTLLVGAPGTWVRILEYDADSKVGFIQKVIGGLPVLGHWLLVQWWPLIIIAALIVIALKFRPNTISHSTAQVATGFFAAAAFSILVLIPHAYYVEREFFSGAIFLVCGFGALTVQILQNNVIKRWIIKMISVAAVSLAIVTYLWLAGYMTLAYNTISHNKTILSYAKQHDLKHVIIVEMPTPPKQLDRWSPYYAQGYPQEGSYSAFQKEFMIDFHKLESLKFMNPNNGSLR